MKKIIITALIIFGFTSLSVSAQKHRKALAGEDSLVYLSSMISNTRDDSLKVVLNQRFKIILASVLSDPGSFEAPLDSVKILGKIPAPDGKFRIYNWNMPLIDGSNRYFAFLQIKDGKKLRIIELTDLSDSLTDPENKVLGPRNWYGALYYKVILTRSGPKDIYTLLGWDGLSSSVNRKIIEILTFDQSGNPVFGARIFRGFRSGKNARVFFDYPAGTSMMLKYDEQSVTGGKKWNNSKRRFEEESEMSALIIFDHLAPADNKPGNSTDSPSDVYDGLIFKSGTWNFVTNIDARNR